MPINALELLNTHLGRAAAGAVIGGGGALAYNQFTDNDINPYLAAGAGAGIGAGSRFVEDGIRDNLYLKQQNIARTQAGQPMSDDEFFGGNWGEQAPVVNEHWQNVDDTLEEIANLRHQLRLVNQGQHSSIPPQSPILRSQWDEQQQRLQAIQSMGRII